MAGLATRRMMAERIWHHFYDEGVPFEIEPPEEPLFIQLEKTALEFPQVVATDFMGARLTYRQLAEQVKRFASSLSAMGVEPGDRIAIMLPNCPQIIIAYYAALSIGAVVVMTAGGLGSLHAADREHLERDTRGTAHHHQHQGLPSFSTKRALSSESEKTEAESESALWRVCPFV
jgi:non-ribosomal peptide synthetase component F